ncbi:MAG: 2'-5' RNA ligase family protein [Candidatus Pacebacteria bacterium]|jgi:2'-5' RNA ligase|nr:2'-5' RNA ligase family protein [Candidatus Paceibacterota bacterium]
MRNRYFIAHLLAAPVAKYHEGLVRELAEKFDLKMSSGYFPTHITLKAPFEADDEEIPAVRQALQETTQTSVAPGYTICGFGHLGRRVITLDVVHSREAEYMHDRLIKKLKAIPFLTWGSHEPIMHLHITLAKKDIEPKFDKVWEYLKQKETPAFHRSLDNIVLLRKENDAWVVDSQYATPL